MKPPFPRNAFFGPEHRSWKMRQRIGKISFAAFLEMPVYREDSPIDFMILARSICSWLTFPLKGFQ